MAPILVLDREGRNVHFAVGSPGGSRIIGYVARVLVAVLDGKLDPQAAMSRPHIVNRNGPTEIEQVPGWEAWAEKTRVGLDGLKHQVRVREMNSGLQGILWTPSGFVGGTDPRREGLILGD